MLNYFQLKIYRDYSVNFLVIFKADGHLQSITIPKYLNSQSSHPAGTPHIK